GSHVKAAALGEEALTQFEELSRAHPHEPRHRVKVGDCLLCLSHFYRATEQMEQAAAALERALDVRRQMVRDDPGAAEYQAGRAHNNVGTFYQTLGDSAPARAAYEEARELYARLVETHPDEPSYRLSLAIAHNNLGALLRLKADTRTEAEAAYLNALKIYQER